MIIRVWSRNILSFNGYPCHLWGLFEVPLRHFGLGLGLLWDHFGLNLGSLWLGSLWAHFGVTLGSLWGHFGVTLGSLWDHFGLTLKSLWIHFLSLIHISDPTRLGMISYAVFCLKKNKISSEVPPSLFCHYRLDALRSSSPLLHHTRRYPT